MNNNFHTRFGELTDLPAIVDIYNQAIRTKEITGDLVEYEVEDRVNWFRKYNKDHYPIYVAERAGRVVGYCTLSPFRPGRQGMAGIAEISYFLDFSVHGEGIGSALITHAMADCERIGKKSLIAILLDINPRSTNILKKFNFTKWGHFPNVIDLDGRICSQVIYGLKLSS